MYWFCWAFYYKDTNNHVFESHWPNQGVNFTCVVEIILIFFQATLHAKWSLRLVVCVSCLLYCLCFYTSYIAMVLSNLTKSALPATLFLWTSFLFFTDKRDLWRNERVHGVQQSVPQLSTIPVFGCYTPRAYPATLFQHCK